MKMIETLSWILDNDDNRIDNDEKYRLNIEFVHSLGLKCDSVGWSKLDLQSPRADEILSAIDSFCKKNGWKARGVYTRTYEDYTSDWYEIVPTSFKDKTLYDSIECESEQGNMVKIYNLHAYHELRPSPKMWVYDVMFVPERFRDACIRHNIADVDFGWARDMGKYQAEQYFQLYSNHQLPTIALCKDISVDDKENIEALGGYLPKIADIFYKLQQSSSQTCYIESDIPDCNIAQAYVQRTYSMFDKTYSHCMANEFLIHKDLALTMLKEKAISESDLAPALVVKELPGGYTLEHTLMPDRPTAIYLRKSISEYEKLNNTARPVRLLPEKDALKLLKTAKKERKEDFKKALPKVRASEIAETRYAPVLPYYLIADGGAISDEYELLSFDRAVEENALFVNNLLAEELLETKPDGVVFAQCPDGDKIVLCSDGKVIRFSHEEPVAIEEWVSLAQFVADSINE